VNYAQCFIFSVMPLHCATVLASIMFAMLLEVQMVKLYSDPHCPTSHRTRIVLAEKELPVETTELESGNLPADFLKINPYGKLPTVIDRDIVFLNPLL